MSLYVTAMRILAMRRRKPIEDALRLIFNGVSWVDVCWVGKKSHQISSLFSLSGHETS